MPKSEQPKILTVAQAAEKIYGEASGRTTRAVLRLIARESFPGTRKLDPSKPTSPYLIPEVEVNSFIATEKKRGQSQKD